MMTRQPCCAGAAVVEGGPNAVALVRILLSMETVLCRVPSGTALRCGDHVVIPTRYGRDLARVLGPVSAANRSNWHDLVSLDRVATESDLERHASSRERASEALAAARRLVDQYRLDMAMVTAHYVLDESRLVMYFTAESRVDFREMVKELASEFHVRIELRQIGVRDEARVVGGIGVCGRILCCNGMSDKLRPVSIKMAKVQNLALNSMKISGPCGRLLCCLEYEYDFYREQRKGLPNAGTRVRYEGELCRITEVNVLTRRVRLEGETHFLELPADRFVLDPSTSRWRVTESAEPDDRQTERSSQPESLPVGDGGEHPADWGPPEADDLTQDDDSDDSADVLEDEDDLSDRPYDDRESD